MRIGNVVSLIVPKSLINAPEFNLTRSLMKEKRVSHIIDLERKDLKELRLRLSALFLTHIKTKQYDCRILHNKYCISSRTEIFNG